MKRKEYTAVNFSNADFSKPLCGFTFTDCSFVDANMREAEIHGCEFIDCDMRGADLSSSIISNTVFTSGSKYSLDLLLDEFNKEDNISYLMFLLKNAIVKYCMDEYEEDRFNFDDSYKDLSHVGIAYTTTPDGRHEIQFELDLEKLGWRQLVDGVVVDHDEFDLGDKVFAIRDLTDLVKYAEFNSLVSVDEDCLKKAFNMGIDDDGNFYELTEVSEV